MNEPNKVETRFACAEALWQASIRVVVARDREGLNSRAWVSTTAGLSARSDVVIVGKRKERATATPRRIPIVLVFAAGVGAVAMTVILALLPH